MCGIAGGCGAAGHAISARDIAHGGQPIYNEDRSEGAADAPQFGRERVGGMAADLSAAARNFAVHLTYAVRLPNAAQ